MHVSVCDYAELIYLPAITSYRRILFDSCFIMKLFLEYSLVNEPIFMKKQVLLLSLSRFDSESNKESCCILQAEQTESGLSALSFQ